MFCQAACGSWSRTTFRAGQHRIALSIAPAERATNQVLQRLDRFDHTGQPARITAEVVIQDPPGKDFEPLPRYSGDRSPAGCRCRRPTAGRCVHQRAKHTSARPAARRRSRASGCQSVAGNGTASRSGRQRPGLAYPTPDHNRPGRARHPRHLRQLRHAQDPGDPVLAGPASSSHAFHPDRFFVNKPGGTMVWVPHRPADPLRRTKALPCLRKTSATGSKSGIGTRNHPGGERLHRRSSTPSPNIANEFQAKNASPSLARRADRPAHSTLRTHTRDCSAPA